MPEKIPMILESVAVFSVMVSTVTLLVSLSTLLSGHTIASNLDLDFECEGHKFVNANITSLLEPGMRLGGNNTEKAMLVENNKEFSSLITTSMRASLLCAVISFLQVNMSVFVLIGDAKISGSGSCHHWKAWIAFTIFSVTITLLCVIVIFNSHNKLGFGFSGSSADPAERARVYCHGEVRVTERNLDYLYILYLGLTGHILVHGFEICAILSVIGSFTDEGYKPLGEE